MWDLLLLLFYFCSYFFLQGHLHPCGLAHQDCDQVEGLERSHNDSQTVGLNDLLSNPRVEMQLLECIAK